MYLHLLTGTYLHSMARDIKVTSMRLDFHFR